MLLAKKGRAKRIQLPILDVLIWGIDLDSFISNQGWGPGMRATGRFNIRWMVAEDRQRADDLTLEHPNVTTGWHDKTAYAECGRAATKLDGCDDNPIDMLAEAVKASEGRLVVCILTPDHLEPLKIAIAAGVKCIMVEKPPVTTSAEWAEISKLAQANNVLIMNSFQHECCGPVDMLARLAAKHVERYGVENVHVAGRFDQDWQKFGTKNWRIKDKYGGVRDLACHAVSLATRVIGAAVKTVVSAQLRKVRLAMLEEPGLDTGGMQVVFENGVAGVISFTQATEGPSGVQYADHISCTLTCTNPDNGDVVKYAWSLQLCGADTLLIGDANSSVDNPGSWKRWQWRGAQGTIFDAEVADLYAKQPPGHQQGWSDLYYYFFLRCYQRFLAHLGLEAAGYLTLMAYGHAPTFDNEGLNCMSFLDAAIQAFETGKGVETAAIRAENGIEQTYTPPTLAIPDTALADGQGVLK